MSQSRIASDLKVSNESITSLENLTRTMMLLPTATLTAYQTIKWQRSFTEETSPTYDWKPRSHAFQDEAYGTERSSSLSHDSLSSCDTSPTEGPAAIFHGDIDTLFPPLERTTLVTAPRRVGPGRPRLPGTDEERAKKRKLKVKSYVKAFRLRQKEERCQLLAQEFHVPPEGMGETATVDSLDLETNQMPRRKSPHWEVSTMVPAESKQRKGDREHMNRLLANRITSALKNEIPAMMDNSHTNGSLCLNIMLDRYLPDMSISIDRHSKVDSQDEACTESTCKTWLLSASAAFDSRGGDLLRDSLLSMAFCIIARERNDTHLKMQSRYAYGKALRRVRKTLELASAKNVDLAQTWLPLSCLVCAVTELLANCSMASHFKHLDGVALLIERGGPASLASGDVLALFFEHRAFYIAKCCFERRACFYSRKEWIDYPGKGDGDSKLAICPFNTLLEIAYMIPEVMEAFDAEEGIRSLETLQSTLQRVREIDHSLMVWIRHTTQSTPSSLFETHEGGSELFSDSLSFLDFPTALALLYYFSFRACLADIMLDIANCMAIVSTNGNIIGTERMTNAATISSLDMARMICRSMDYCFDPQTKIGGKMIAAFPFNTAWHAFSRAGMQGLFVEDELRWFEKTAERFESHGIPLMCDRRPVCIT